MLWMFVFSYYYYCFYPEHINNHTVSIASTDEMSGNYIWFKITVLITHVFFKYCTQYTSIVKKSNRDIINIMEHVFRLASVTSKYELREYKFLSYT